MGGLRRCREEYFVLAILLVGGMLVSGVVAGSCPAGVESSTVDDRHNEHHGHGGERLEFASHHDDLSQHDSGHSQCQGGHHHDHDHHKHAHDHGHFPTSKKFRLPEELEEEEDLRLYGFGSRYADHEEDAHDEDHLSTTAWVHILMVCSYLSSCIGDQPLSLPVDRLHLGYKAHEPKSWGFLASSESFSRGLTLNTFPSNFWFTDNLYARNWAHWTVCMAVGNGTALKASE